MQDQFIVIMAGGKGERFWPESRLERPKHLLPIVGSSPMLRQTLDRIGDLVPREHILIITNVSQQSAIREMCPDLPPDNVVAEPVGRDTAPAVGLAMALVRHRNPKAVFALLPADHVIHDAEKFQACLRSGFEVARSQKVLVTIGITPTHAATGYGYIHRGTEWAGHEGRGIYDVKRFVEKPSIERAREYVHSGEYFWNAGMFVWSVESITEAFQLHHPALLEGVNSISQGLRDGRELSELLGATYPTLEKISIDFAMMEKAKNVVTIQSTFDWDDVGEWPAIERHGAKDGEGNLLSGLGVVQQASNNIVYNDGKRITALLGVDDLIVVHTEDATLVCHRSKAQEIKGIVKALGECDSTRGFL